MSELDIVDARAFQRMEQVAELYLQSKSPYQIARTLGIKVVEAKQAIEQWHEVVANDLDARDAAKDHLNTMVHRYETLISEANDNLKNLKRMGFDEKVSAQINTTLKTIGELDAKRLDFLQRAGLLDAHDLGDELAEREEQEQKLLEILRNDLCEECQQTVAKKLQKITNVVEVMVEYPEDDE